MPLRTEGGREVYLTTQEAVDWWNSWPERGKLATRTLISWIEKGYLKTPVKIAGRWLFPLRELQNLKRPRLGRPPKNGDQE